MMGVIYHSNVPALRAEGDPKDLPEQVDLQCEVGSIQAERYTCQSVFRLCRRLSETGIAAATRFKRAWFHSAMPDCAGLPRTRPQLPLPCGAHCTPASSCHHVQETRGTQGAHLLRLLVALGRIVQDDEVTPNSHSGALSIKIKGVTSCACS